MIRVRRKLDGRAIVWVVGAALIVALPLLAVYAGRTMYPGDDSTAPADPIVVDTIGPPGTSSTTAPAASSEPATTGLPPVSSTTSSVASTTTRPTTTTTEVTRKTTSSTAPTTTTRVTRPTTTSTAPTTTTRVSRPTTTSTQLTTPAVAVSYSTLPDGSPQPVVAIFDVDTITLSGTVPSQAAADRLGALALANSKTPASLVKFLDIDPNVPKSVGVRVIELTSFRFPESSAVIRPDHALEFDRVATVMEALPNVTALVIGHADQRGSSKDNFAISDARARATVSYLVGKGIDPDRLSSRAVGETDLLILNDDETAFALNRRTEFVFYGLVADT